MPPTVPSRAQSVTRPECASSGSPHPVSPPPGGPRLRRPRTTLQRGTPGHSSASATSVPRARGWGHRCSRAHGRCHLCPPCTQPGPPLSLHTRPVPLLSPRHSAVPCGPVAGLDVPPRPAKAAAPPFPRSASASPWPPPGQRAGPVPPPCPPCRLPLGGLRVQSAGGALGARWLRWPERRSPGVWETSGRRVTEVVSFAARGLRLTPLQPGGRCPSGASCWRRHFLAPALRATGRHPHSKALAARPSLQPRAQ